ncbi:hypothetical protein EXIGLDRAFT_751527 [Exidia glandulosa HHB12029]|uniref:Uncharacterized protein n=1 Tax=Exidia glandulosa HHB12029 TaxID=1314781 RepID=A0A165FC37_EXIGL|nr:hypothetical protein EXIGLDRAFT_751527 [Exidia glandulosa HHB12029]
MGTLEPVHAGYYQHCPIGSIVVVSIDPVASVAPLRDDVASEAAKRIPRGRYLVLIDIIHGLDFYALPEASPLKFLFYMIGRGLPDPPYACVPLSPDAPHPFGRAAVALPSPLPWPDCYVHTLLRFSAQIIRIYADSPSRILLSEEDQGLVVSSRVEDGRAAERSIRPSVPETEEAPNPDLDALEDQLTYDMTEDDLPPPQAGTPSVHEDERTGTATSSSATDDDEPMKLQIRAEMWLNVADVSQPGNPQVLADQIRQLVAIEKDWAQRTVLRQLADQPRTRKWAAAVANEGVSATGPSSCSHSRSASNIALDDVPMALADGLEHGTGREVDPTMQNITARPSRGKSSVVLRVTRFLTKRFISVTRILGFRR